MERLYLEGNDLLPKIVLDKQLDFFEISGISSHRDVSLYFEKVLKWFDNYLREPLKKTTVHFNIEYYNPESSFLIFKIMQKLQYLKDYGNDVHVRWYYDKDNDSILETGKDLKEIFVLDIDLVQRNAVTINN
jgi:hypothetical protein